MNSTRRVLFAFGENGIASPSALRTMHQRVTDKILENVNLLSGINFHLLDRDAKLNVLEALETNALSLNGQLPNQHDGYRTEDYQFAVRALIRNFILNGYEVLVRVRNKIPSAPIDYCDPITAPPEKIMIRRNATGHSVLSIEGKDYIPGIDDTGLEITIVFLGKPEEQG